MFLNLPASVAIKVNIASEKLEKEKYTDDDENDWDDERQKNDSNVFWKIHIE